MIDWLLDLPKELTIKFNQEIHEYEKEKKMPYITSIERLGMEKGLKEGLEKGLKEGLEKGSQDELLGVIEFGLQKQFGKKGAKLFNSICKIKDVEKLRAIYQALWNDDGMEEIQKIIS